MKQCSEGVFMKKIIISVAAGLLCTVSMSAAVACNRQGKCTTVKSCNVNSLGDIYVDHKKRPGWTCYSGNDDRNGGDSQQPSGKETIKRSPSGNPSGKVKQ